MGASCPDVPGTPVLTSRGRRFSFAACAYGGFQHNVRYTELPTPFGNFWRPATSKRKFSESTRAGA
jgi:hypothetical protein